MESLKAIQTLSKIAKILSKIVFVFCIVALIICIVAGVCLCLLPNTININGVTIHGLIEKNSGIPIPAIYSLLIIGISQLICSSYIAKKSCNYFKKELNDGTPFTEEGAKMIKNLGFISIFLPLIVHIGCAIVLAIINALYPITKNIKIEFSYSISLGIYFLILSLIFSYGASLTTNKENNKLETNKEEEE